MLYFMNYQQICSINFWFKSINILKYKVSNEREVHTKETLILWYLNQGVKYSQGNVVTQVQEKNIVSQHFHRIIFKFCYFLSLNIHDAHYT